MDGYASSGERGGEATQEGTCMAAGVTATGPPTAAPALRTLDIEPIHASTPQAKGRVERANRTLQDRLWTTPSEE